MEILEFCAKQLKSANVDKFEIYYEKSSNVSVEVKDGKLDHLSRATDQGLAIRVLKDHRLGFSYTFDLSRNAAEQAIRTAVELSQLMPADPYQDLGKAGPWRSEAATPPDRRGSMQAEELDVFDPTGASIALEQKIELARKMEADALRQDARIKRIRKSGFDQSSAVIRRIDSDGSDLSLEQTVFGCDLTCVAEDAGDAQIGSEGDYACRFSAVDPSYVTRTAVEGALELLHAGQAPTIACPAIFRNSITAQLVGFLGSAFSAESIDKKSSFLIGKKGEKLFSDKLWLIDDGRRRGGVASSLFDAEGTPTQTTTLVGGGVIENFLYDGYHARKLSAETGAAITSTGNSRRGGLKNAPSVGATNLYMRAGTHRVDELVASVDRGVLITEVMGLHTANPITGEFSVGASGLLIEKGRISRPIKGFAVAGNLIALLAGVAEVGSDLRFWGSIGAPSILVKELSISGS